MTSDYKGKLLFVIKEASLAAIISYSSLKILTKKKRNAKKKLH